MAVAQPKPSEPPLNLKRLTGVAEGTQPLALRRVAEASGKPVLYITPSDRELRRVVENAAFFLPDFDVLSFPAWDCLPYDRAAPHPSIMAERVATLARLASAVPNGRTLIVTTASAFLQKLPPKSAFAGAKLVLKKGAELSIEALGRRLQDFGYRRSGKAMEPGEYAVRGSILDVFASGTGDQALRVDFFGDEIESIRWFDPLTQRSTDAVDAVTLYPVSEILLNETNAATFRERYRQLFGVPSKEDTLYASVSNLQYSIGMEHWMPLFYERTETMLDYIPEAAIALAGDVWHTLEERQELIRDYYQARKDAANLKQKQAVYNPVPPEEMFMLGVALEVKLGRKSLYQLTPFSGGDDALELKTQGVRKLYSLAKQQQLSPFALLADEARESVKAGRSILITAATDGSLGRLVELLNEFISPASPNDHTNHPHPNPPPQAGEGFEASPRRRGEVGGGCQTANQWGDIIVRPGLYAAVVPLEQGFATPQVTVYSEQDILGHRVIQTKKRKRNADAFLQEAASFEPGELLVHKDHGIGRFDGLVTMEAGGKRHDCLKLIYKDDDKLFLPVENMDLIARYGEETAGAELDKLGAGSWQARKARMKERIRMAADELMKVAAARALRPGHKLHAAPGTYEEFCARFPYDETEDQQRSIDEVEADLALGKPMDRLICGDVGFGKTEVAIRAAFIAAADPVKPVQVALICPTTLLARQHFRGFRKRFEETGLEVRMLSRLTSAKDAKATREGLKAGTVDIVIGTHALLSKQVEFANLGLLIIDEEQHFGVKQKEALKQLKANIHILTLSATPIPRTLQLALAGVRELSLITTPPVDRLAVRSFVLPYDAVVIKEAIQREIHRGGQVFYVTPRVADIAELTFKIRELVPTARLAVAHGQLPATELDQIMNDFYDGKFDVLLSTAIVESGIDVPTANTLIVNRADMFGLAQLYQLRGRVGRGKTRAYAYFTLPHHAKLTDQATRRLEVMQSLDTLGAGFTLASHDMDIRGFGNLVGEEQSGHIKEVGVELYQQMLSEAVAAARAAKLPDAVPEEDGDWSPQINLGVSVLIPEDYVEDLTLRLSLYRRLSSLKSEEDIDSFAAEMADRFGPLPTEVQALLEVMRIKQLSRAACVERIDTGPKGAVVTLRHNQFPKPDALIGFIAKNAHRMKIRADQKLVLTANWNSEKERLRGVHEFLKQVAGLAA
jgi:transcription-repair coupling factor (superfamily II helicase)